MATAGVGSLPLRLPAVSYASMQLISVPPLDKAANALHNPVTLPVVCQHKLLRS